jgi:hypothetical protein
MNENAEIDLDENNVWIWLGLIWLRIGSDGKLFQTWYCKFRFHKRHGVSLLAE